MMQEYMFAVAFSSLFDQTKGAKISVQLKKLVTKISSFLSFRFLKNPSKLDLSSILKVYKN